MISSQKVMDVTKVALGTPVRYLAYDSKAKGFLFILLACLLWSIDVLIRYPLIASGVSPAIIVFYEHLFVTLLFIPFAIKHYKRIQSLPLSHLFCFIIVGAWGSGIGNLFFSKAIGIANPSAIILISKLQLIIAVSLSYLVLKEKIRKEFLLWSSLAMLGAFLVSYHELKPFLEEGFAIFSQDQVWGYLYALIAVGGWGTAIVFAKKLSLCGYTEKEIIAGRFFWGLIAMIPFIKIETLTFLPSITVNTGSRIALLVFGFALSGMYFYYLGLSLVKARIGAVAELFFPLLAVSVSWIFLGKPLSGIQITGGIILVVCSLMIQLKRY